MQYTKEQTKAIHNYLHNFVKALQKSETWNKKQLQKAEAVMDKDSIRFYKKKIKENATQINAMCIAYEALPYSGEPKFVIETPLK